MDQVSDDPNRNNDKGKTHEIAHRLSHKKARKLSQKPANESLHISHEEEHPPA